MRLDHNPDLRQQCQEVLEEGSQVGTGRLQLSVLGRSPDGIIFGYFVVRCFLLISLKVASVAGYHVTPRASGKERVLPVAALNVKANCALAFCMLSSGPVDSDYQTLGSSCHGALAFLPHVLSPLGSPPERVLFIGYYTIVLSLPTN